MADYDTTALVDPDLAPLLALGGALSVSAETLAAMRERTAELFRQIGGESPAARVVTAPPGVEVRLQLPEGAGKGLKPAIYHIHGGGFVAGSAEMCDALNWRRAAELGCVVASVEYRRAPETAFPGPLEDCYAGLRWLFEHAGELGVDPGRVVLMGESAGGGLAAALALLARDRGGSQPSGQVLTYPMLDHRTGGPDDVYRNAHTGQFIWNPASNRFGWASMKGGYDLDPERIAYFSPACASDLAGLPPAFIGVGTLDLFLDEDVDYAARLARAGVPVELHVYPGCFHGFDAAPAAAVAQRYAAELSGALMRMLAIR